MSSTLIVNTKGGRKQSLITTTRIKKAKKLLLTTNLTLKQIADSLNVSLVTITKYRTKLWPDPLVRAKVFEQRRIRLRNHGVYNHIPNLVPHMTNKTPELHITHDANINQLQHAINSASATVRKFK